MYTPAGGACFMAASLVDVQMAAAAADDAAGGEACSDARLRVRQACPAFFDGHGEGLLAGLAEEGGPAASATNRLASIDHLIAINQQLRALEEEEALLFGSLKEAYSARFPEMDSFGLSTVLYARTVLALGDAADLTSVDLRPILPPSTLLAMAMPASTTAGRPLPGGAAAFVAEAASVLLAMAERKARLLGALEARIGGVAPNVCAIVGTRIASLLVGAAGSMRALAAIPAGNLAAVGRSSASGRVRDGAAFTVVADAAAAAHGAGFLSECDLIGRTEEKYRAQAHRLVASKVALAARIDSLAPAGAPGGAQYGLQLRQEIITKLERLAEPAAKAAVKPIPPPPITTSKKRGGRRARRQKELYSQTEIRRLTNRMEFGRAEEQVILGSSVVGLGELGKAGLGSEAGTRIRQPRADARLSEHAKRAAQVAYAPRLGGLQAPPAKAAATGTTTSLSMTPGQGIHLQTFAEAPAGSKSAAAPSRYFGTSLSFRK